MQTPTLAASTVTDPDVGSIAVPDHGYLQTSPEYFLKRLLAAGAPSCYQLGPVFRRDEMGRHHHPEFTLLEWYRLDFDHQELMQEVAAYVNLLLGDGDYQQVSYESLVGDLTRDREQLDLSFAQSSASLSPGRFFIVDYPADQAALARTTGLIAHRFELVIDGVEVANGYWELTDADEHRRRFAVDNERRRERGDSSVPLDERFLAALDSGLPDCAGVALGFDRLLMLGLGKDSLAEVIAFT